MGVDEVAPGVVLLLVSVLVARLGEDDEGTRISPALAHPDVTVGVRRTARGYGILVCSGDMRRL